MGYIKMLIAIAVTIFAIIKINNQKKYIVPVCAIYFLVNVLNDIFNAGSPIHLADAFGISYQFDDTLMLIFIGILFLDLSNYHCVKKNKSNIFIAIITILIILSMILGAVQFGLTSEWMGDLRSFGLFITGILYFARFFKISYMKEYIAFIDKCMGIILVISIILWTLDLGAGIHILASQYNATLSDGGSTMRFVQSYEVLGLAIYALYLIRRDIREKSRIGIKAFAYIMAVILFQHRSIWLALGIGIIVIVLEEMNLHKLSKKMLGQFAIIGVLMACVLLFGSGDIVENIRNGFDVFGKLVSGASLENTTANTRVQVWSAVREDLTNVAFFLGRPFGYGYGQSIGWSTSPHSGYIRLLGRTGYIGLCVFIALMIFLIFKLKKRHAMYALEFLACVIAFMYSYDFTWLCGCIIGAGIVMSSGATSKK